MPKRTDLKKILVIGSGPIVIGQAAEFDYAGTQACLALKEEGYEVILCNSNPATIMTDPAIADKVYMEPLTLEYIARIVRFERPDAIIPGIGGQTGLNLAMQLEKKGILKECHVQLLGTPSESIEQAEDRELFKELCQRLGEPVLPSQIANTMEEGLAAAETRQCRRFCMFPKAPPKNCIRLFSRFVRLCLRFLRQRCMHPVCPLQRNCESCRDSRRKSSPPFRIVRLQSRNR